MSESDIFISAASSRNSSSSNTSDNDATSRSLTDELRKEVMRFYRAQYKHDIITSLWETYQAFLANQLEQAYQQEADETIEDLNHASQDEAIRTTAKYRRLTSR